MRQRTFFLFFLLGWCLIALTAIVKGQEEERAANYAYQMGRCHKANGMKYDCPFAEIHHQRAYAFGWMADTR